MRAEGRENICIALKWFCGDIWCYIMLESARPWFLFIAICKIRCNLHISKGFDEWVQYLVGIWSQNSAVSSPDSTKYKVVPSLNTFIFFLRTLLSTLMKNAFRFQSRWQEMTEIPRFHFLAGWDVNVTSASFLSSDYKSSSSSRESFEKCQWLSPNGFPYLRRSK